MSDVLDEETFALYGGKWHAHEMDVWTRSIVEAMRSRQCRFKVKETGTREGNRSCSVRL